jgi:CheY-like chemotaxis protein
LRTTLASILIVTDDVSASATLEEIANATGLRAKTVASLDAAREWLAMQSYDFLLADTSLGQEKIYQLVESCWRKTPFMVSAMFNLRDQIDDNDWRVRLAGIRTFNGATALEGIRKLLTELPEWLESNAELGVLLVEDLDAPRDILSAYIESMGYQRVVGAESAAAALQILERNPNQFFAVVTDVNMPGQNGIELIEQIRRDESSSSVPVIVITAYATPENLLECVRAGASGFLVKPPRKQLMKKELEKAKRMFLSKQSPRICQPEEAEQLEAALLATIQR